MSFSALLFLGESPRHPTPGQGASIDEIFAGYRLAHYERTHADLVAALSSDNTRDKLLFQLKDRVKTWPTRLAAAFSLETAAASATAGQWHAAEIVEDAGSRLADSEVPDEFERSWRLAATALLDGPPALEDLPGGQWPFGSQHREEHLRQSRRRFPEDALFVLAWGIFHEQLHFNFRRLQKISADSASRLVPNAELVIGARSLTEAERAFTSASSASTVKEEAILRLGRIAFYRNQHERAIGLWREVSSTSSSSRARYLAMSFAARALVAVGRRRDAIDLYRQALRLYPGASSARMPLAALLFLTDSRAEASSLAESLESTNEYAADPWLTYLQGSYHLWRVRLDRVREQVR